jgi:uncharacterized membrane protein (UPF0127 family)
MTEFNRFLFFIALLLLAGCQDEGGARIQADSETRFALKLGEKTIQARLAMHDAERQKGLMHVESMPGDEGMLFLFKEASIQGFWMMNTLIPLDIGYFTSDGILREVHRMYPKNLASVRSNRNDIQYALEMNQGWFRENEVLPGTQLNLSDLAKALKARGESPANWGLTGD